eukprot:7970870-Alexandrium_andersonii.AAC.1
MDCGRYPQLGQVRMQYPIDSYVITSPVFFLQQCGARGRCLRTGLLGRDGCAPGQRGCGCGVAG